MHLINNLDVDILLLFIALLSNANLYPVIFCLLVFRITVFDLLFHYSVCFWLFFSFLWAGILDECTNTSPALPTLLHTTWYCTIISAEKTQAHSFSTHTEIAGNGELWNVKVLTTSLKWCIKIVQIIYCIQNHPMWADWRALVFHFSPVSGKSILYLNWIWFHISVFFCVQGSVPKVIIPSLEGNVPTKLSSSFNKVNTRYPSNPQSQTSVLHKQVSTALFQFFISSTPNEFSFIESRILLRWWEVMVTFIFCLGLQGCIFCYCSGL